MVTSNKYIRFKINKIKISHREAGTGNCSGNVHTVVCRVSSNISKQIHKIFKSSPTQKYITLCKRVNTTNTLLN